MVNLNHGRGQQPHDPNAFPLVISSSGHWTIRRSGEQRHFRTRGHLGKVTAQRGEELDMECPVTLSQVGM